jgi:hypothetical protein
VVAGFGVCRVARSGGRGGCQPGQKPGKWMPIRRRSAVAPEDCIRAVGRSRGGSSRTKICVPFSFPLTGRKPPRVTLGDRRSNTPLILAGVYYCAGRHSFVNKRCRREERCLNVMRSRIPAAHKEGRLATVRPQGPIDPVLRWRIEIDVLDNSAKLAKGRLASPNDGFHIPSERTRHFSGKRV